MVEPLPASFYSEGARIAAHLYPASPCDDPGRAVVLCHGFCGIKEWLIPPFASAFAEAGIAALTFDYRGFGGSEGTRGRLVPAEQVDDIRNAITYLEAVDGVDPVRIGLWGTSFGGANVLVAAAQDERAQAVVSQVAFGSGPRVLAAQSEASDSLTAMLVEDRCKRVLEGKVTRVPATMLAGEDLARFLEESYETMPELAVEIEVATVERIADYVPESYAAAIAPRPLLVVGCENDETTPPAEARSIYDCAEMPKLWLLLPGRGHFDIYFGEGREEALDIETSFLIESL